MLADSLACTAFQSSSSTMVSGHITYVTQIAFALLAREGSGTIISVPAKMRVPGTPSERSRYPKEVGSAPCARFHEHGTGRHSNPLDRSSNEVELWPKVQRRVFLLQRTAISLNKIPNKRYG